MKNKIGIDLGNYTTKAVNSKGKEVEFQSRFKLLVKSDVSDAFDTSFKIVYGGETYRQGDGEFEVKNNKFDRSNILINFASALGQLADDGTAVDVAVGVPVGQYLASKDRITSMLMSNPVYDVVVGGVSKRITLTSVTVVPEAIGAYYDLPEEIMELKGKNDLTIVDIGGKTTDICIIDKNNAIRKNNTIQKGAFDTYELIMNKINTDYPSACVTLEEIEDIVEDDLYIRGERVDYKPYINSVLEQEAKEIARAIELNDKKSLRSLIVITGGHGKTLYPYIIKHITHAKSHGNSVFANANGYLEYLMEKEELANG